MEDKKIIDLYLERNEQAINEECVNDTYYSVWNKIPPTIPESFKAFLGRITRNISISKFRTMRAKKRYSNMEIMLSELSDCVPSSTSVEQSIEVNQLSEYISDWLDSLSDEEQALFVQRYWFGEEVQALAKKCDISAAKMAQRMFRLRKSLKTALEKKGVVL